MDRIASLAASLLESAGVAVIVLGIVYAFARAIRQNSYQALRQRVGRSVLLGLELLVGADIVRTVTTRPELQQVSVLGLIVLVRTFLSFSLQMELEGRWPWQTGHARPPSP